MKVLRAVFLLAAGVGLFHPSSARADAYDTLRAKYVTKLTGYDPASPYSLTDTYVAVALDGLDQNTQTYWTSMNAVKVWDDVETSSLTVSAGVTTMYGRLMTMAQAWSSPGSAYYQNTSMLADIKTGLDWLYTNRYNASVTEYDNWWDWEIGSSTDLDIIMVYLYSSLSSTQLGNYEAAIDHFTTVNLDDPSRPWTGANRTWMCKVWVLRGIVGKSSTLLSSGSSGLTAVFSFANPTDEGGFLTDGSYLQHYYYAYAGGYGRGTMEDVTEMLWLLAGSTWDNTAATKANVFTWFALTFEPEIYQDQIFDSTRGREISRSPSLPTRGLAIIQALLMQILITANPYVTDMEAYVKYTEQYNLDLFYRGLPIWDYLQAKAIAGNGAITPLTEIIGNFQHYNEDRVTQRASDWAYNIAMHSLRRYNYESINGENLKSWYTADGMTYFYNDPTDYNLNFWWTVDPHRLPGITVDRDTTRPNGSGQGTPGLYAWVGGVELDGLYGTAGLNFKQHNYSNMDLSAKKSWFMFDDEIVALGAGVTSTSGRTIETIVENRGIDSAGDNAFTVNGTAKSTALGWTEAMTGVTWAQLDGTGGYVFPGGASLTGLREQRTGLNSDINTGGATYYQADEFNSTTRSTNWSFVREDATHYSFSGTAFVLTTQTGSLDGSTNTTKNILWLPATPQDFRADTKLTFAPTQAGQEAGVILFIGDNDYVALTRSYTAAGLKVVARSETGGTLSSSSFADSYGAAVYLRIVKQAGGYKMYASSDGVSWGSALTTYFNSLAGTDQSNSSLRMGLFGQSGTGSAPSITASFDYFHSTSIKNYLTLWQSHGVNPTNQGYSYIFLPNQTATQTSTYAASPNAVVLRNDTTVQAARETTLGITGANFWNAGTIDYLTASDSAAVMAKDTGTQVEVAVADPMQTKTSIAFEVVKSGTATVSHDANITVTQLTPTIKFTAGVTANRGGSSKVLFNYQPFGFTDQFNSTTKDSRWYFVREDSAHWSLSANPGSLRIDTDPGDIWLTTNTAKNLCLQYAPSGDYTLTTKLSFNPTTNYQVAGLIAYADDDNYIRVERAYASGKFFRLIKEVGASGVYQQVADTLGGTIYLKLVKSGTSFSGYFSSDGTTWTQIGTAYTGVTLSVPKVGLHAFHSGSATSIAALFDYFTFN